MKYSSLRDLKPGVSAVVSNILIDGDFGVYLTELGIQRGAELIKKRDYWLGASLIEVEGSCYGIGRDLSKKIVVRYNKG